MEVGFFDDQAFRWQASRHANLDLARADGSTIVRALVDWAKVAPKRPQNPADPLAHAYRLDDLDELVQNATERGMQVLLTIWGTPAWANGGAAPNVAPTKPRDLRDFAHALAARYSGRYPKLPAVRFFSVWNEPNSALFLSPQFDASGAAVAPQTYAGLVAAAYKGIKSANPTALVAAGETAPRGHDRHVDGLHDAESPLAFARLVAKAAPHLPFDAWAHHPYPRTDLQPPDASLAELGPLTTALERGFHRRDVRLWVTELGYRTRPQISGAAPYRMQASYLMQAIALARAQPNVDMFIWFRFRDEARQPWQSGLLDAQGDAKPALATFAVAASCERSSADPCVQVGPKLAAAGTNPGDTFGSGLALSADGRTALMSAPGHAGNDGAAWVFARTASGWQQAAVLQPWDEVGSGRVGVRVALSADGRTALLGAPWDNLGAGAAWVFVRSGSSWVQQGPKLVAGDGPQQLFGAAVALSGDGDTALVGAHADGLAAGSAWVFSRSGSTWTQPQALAPADESGAGRFGVSVALSSDGATALVGGYEDGRGAGAAWVFEHSGSGWTQQGPKLVPRDEAGAGSFGGAASLSTDGSVALVGGEDDDGGVGAAWVFVRRGTTWAQQGPKLTARGEAGPGGFGRSAELSGDGATAVIGASGDSADRGAAWVFVRSGDLWSQSVTKLTGTTQAGAGWFGKRVALSADGDTALVSAPGDNQNVGAVWTFVSLGPGA